MVRLLADLLAWLDGHRQVGRARRFRAPGGRTHFRGLAPRSSPAPCGRIGEPRAFPRAWPKAGARAPRRRHRRGLRGGGPLLPRRSALAGHRGVPARPAAARFSTQAARPLSCSRSTRPSGGRGRGRAHRRLGPGQLASRSRTRPRQRTAHGRRGGAARGSGRDTVAPPECPPPGSGRDAADALHCPGRVGKLRA